MKKFLAVFTAPIEAYDRMKEMSKHKTPEENAAEMEAWKAWMGKHADAIVDPGAGVKSAKRVSDGGTITDTRNEIGGFMVIRAESADDAAAIFKDSPHFGVSGGSIDVMEMVEM